MLKNDLRIDILGTSLTISADEKPEYLNMLLEKYRRTIENVQRISGLEDPLKTAILTGFLLCDDLEKAGAIIEEELGSGGETRPAPHGTEEAESNSGEAEKLTMGMISRLEELVSGTGNNELSGNPQFEKIYKLRNEVKNYEWGSPDWIPELLGEKNFSRVPWAELWMGVNPAGPSRAVSGDDPGESGVLLSELIAQNPAAILGTDIAGKFGSLPFLFKVEAAAKPLSIQTHPDSGQAREGFERENREGIPLDSPYRNYRNPNHKPEIICALSPFAALCGFREAGEIAGFLEELALGFTLEQDNALDYDQAAGTALKAGIEKTISALRQDSENPYRAFLTVLFNLGTQALRAMGPFIQTHAPVLAKEFPEHRDEWQLCSYLAAQYPGDPGILAPLYLNLIELASGEAMFLPAGILHSYIHGMGIELMADSDTVIRGGLTSKYVDPDEMLRVLNFSEFKPEILKVPDPSPSWYSYPSPAGEFTLSVMRGSGDAVTLNENGPLIAVITAGNAVVSYTGSGSEVPLKTGESVFIPAGAGRNIQFKGTFTAYAAAAGKITGEPVSS